MLKKLLIVVFLLFVAIQFVPVHTENPPVNGPLQIESLRVKEILKESCMDCHSNTTDWPWYASVAPFSWKISEHVNEGRKELNFSEWGTYSTEKAIHKLEEVVEEVEEGHMPEDSYTWLHAEAEITEEELLIIRNWVTAETQKLTIASDSL